jgi:mannose-6-phosphate isomerase-like protein (cupin superfamily)
MRARPPRLQSLLDLLSRSVSADPKRSADVVRVMDLVEQRLQRPADTAAAPPAPVRLPVCAWLERALAAETPLLQALRAVEPDLAWHRRKGELGDDRFRAGHANAMLVGPGGLEPRDDVWIGVSLMAPETSYPVHHHPPEEVYLVLSGGEWWNERDGWYEPGIGGTVHHHPDQRHAMRSGEAPLFAFWALPI